MRTSRRLKGLEPEGLKEVRKKRAIEAGLAQEESGGKTIRFAVRVRVRVVAVACCVPWH